MSNLQIKGIEEGLYRELKRLAAEENRSVSQQLLFLIRRSLAERRRVKREDSAADVLLSMAGSWEDSRPAERILDDIRESRRSSKKFSDGF